MQFDELLVVDDQSVTDVFMLMEYELAIKKMAYGFTISHLFKYRDSSMFLIRVSIRLHTLLSWSYMLLGRESAINDYFCSCDV